MKNILPLLTGQLDFHEKLTEELSSYPEKIIHSDGSVLVEQIKNPYFLLNDTWNIRFICRINQFEEMLKDHIERYKSRKRLVHFKFTSHTLNLETKYVWYSKLFNDEWSLAHFFGQLPNLNKLALFINQEYPSLRSFIDLDIEKAEREWVLWLSNQGVRIEYTQKGYVHKSQVVTFLRMVHTAFMQLTDYRDEWEKDRWNLRILHDKYGIEFNQSRNDYYIDFTNIEPTNIRKQVKKYIKQKLLSNNNFSWSSAQLYLSYITKFLVFILSLEPTWDSLKGLKRHHMEKYIQWLHEYVKSNIKQKSTHPANYIKRALEIVGKFIEDMQRYQYHVAPEIHARMLLYPEDKPKLKKKSIDQIDYIPDYVLEQLFIHINDLHSDLIPIVWIAYKTGLRISDVLGLTSDCLIRLNGKYTLVTDIEKTYVKGHRVPIDDELANILAVLIDQSKNHSNQDNNPHGFIFVRYRGSRKGLPFDQGWIRKKLNAFSKQNNIIDENGILFHFKTHQFRHTYAVKMLNGGADILTVQELLAHASPEMTLRYARLLDDTKRKTFERIVKEGVFTFDLNGRIHQVSEGEEVPEDIMDMLWRNEKLYALDNPYGSCRARVNGNCPIAIEPPCLTANDGKPCYDLAVGISDMDFRKYELHIESTSKMIEAAKQYGREDMIEVNQKNLERYQEIYETIKSGNVIFGHFDRIRRELNNKKGVRRG